MTLEDTAISKKLFDELVHRHQKVCSDCAVYISKTDTLISVIKEFMGDVEGSDACCDAYWFDRFAKVLDEIRR